MLVNGAAVFSSFKSENPLQSHVQIIHCRSFSAAGTLCKTITLILLSFSSRLHFVSLKITKDTLICQSFFYPNFTCDFCLHFPSKRGIVLLGGSGGMADAHASGACEIISCGFNSHLPHFTHQMIWWAFFVPFSIIRTKGAVCCTYSLTDAVRKKKYAP